MDTFSLSSDLEVRPTSYGGRGVFARRYLPEGHILLDVPSPIAHVVYRLFRREACAECFAYDNGQTWRMSSCSQAVFFCSPRCQDTWETRTGELGMRAWTNVEEWAKKAAARTSKKHDSDSDSNVEDVPVAKGELERVWKQAQKTADALDGVYGAKAQSRADKAINALHAHPDVITLLLSGVVTFYRDPAKLVELKSLAPTPTPYRNAVVLREHAESFLVLRRLVPDELKPYVTVENVREIAIRDAHNSFGMWSQPEDDGAEMLGFGIWAASSFFNHSCDPAVTKTRIGRAWRFHLDRDVDAGEELCISYLGETELREWTVNIRRQQLKKAWGFECACTRCEM